jgi:hypothetical protein
MMVITNLPEDLQYNITTFLNIIDTITFYKSLNCKFLLDVYYISAIKIQQWYKKYKSTRYIRYETLKAEYQKSNEKMYTTRYLEIFFVSYNVKQLIKRLREYHFYARMDYYYRCDETEKERYEEKSNIFKLYKYTLDNLSYSNLKIFLKQITIPLLHKL